MRFRCLAAIALCWLAAPQTALPQEPKQTPPAEPRLVPYRLTDTQHVLVRVKINGKGPFNFIVDTGAPVMFLAVPIAKKIGIDNDKKGMATLEKLEIEGGLVQEKVRCRIETPFQLEGMNGMGLAGAELHGILGYMTLAKYRMEFDFTQDKMRWTPLDFKPPPPVAIGGKGSQGGLELIGGLMKFLGGALGMKPAGPPHHRGFLGIELEGNNETVHVHKIYEGAPAAKSDLAVGDAIVQINGKAVKSRPEAQRLTAGVVAGEQVRLSILRGDEKKEITIKAGDGL